MSSVDSFFVPGMTSCSGILSGWLRTSEEVGLQMLTTSLIARWKGSFPRSERAALRVKVSWFGTWAVSNLGRVRNTRGLTSWGASHPSGYPRVLVSIDGAKKSFLVHRLVAQAFLGDPPSDKHVVNHRDGNRGNNHISNLEFMTVSENLRHSYSRRASQSKICRRGKAVQARPQASLAWTLSFLSISAASQELSISAKEIKRCCEGSLLASNGYEFCFEGAADLPGEFWVQAVCPRANTVVPLCYISSHGRFHGPSTGRTYGAADFAGYHRVQYNGTSSYVHRIMACSFLGMHSLDYRLQVNHKDGCKCNNHIDNLEVVTRSENMRHAFASRAGIAAPRPKKAIEGREWGSSEWILFTSVSEAARQRGLAPSGIYSCCLGLQKSAGGWEWQNAPKFSDLPGEVWRDVELTEFMWIIERSGAMPSLSQTRAQAITNLHFGSISFDTQD